MRNGVDMGVLDCRYHSLRHLLLGSTEHADALDSTLDLPHELHLLPDSLRAQAVGDSTTTGVTGDGDVLVPALARRQPNLLERDGTNAPLAVHVQVAAYI